MSKGSAPRKVRDDAAYSANWEKIFGRLQKKPVQKNRKTNSKQGTVPSMGEDRSSGTEKDTGDGK